MNKKFVKIQENIISKKVHLILSIILLILSGIILFAIDMNLSKLNEQLNNIDERKGYDEVNLLLTSNQQIKLAIADITKNSVIALNDSADTTFFETLSRKMVLANINALSKGDINLTI